MILIFSFGFRKSLTKKTVRKESEIPSAIVIRANSRRSRYSVAASLPTNWCPKVIARRTLFVPSL